MTEHDASAGHGSASALQVSNHPPTRDRKLTLNGFLTIVVLFGPIVAVPRGPLDEAFACRLLELLDRYHKPFQLFKRAVSCTFLGLHVYMPLCLCTRTVLR